jgi:hypothetical protein
MDATRMSNETDDDLDSRARVHLEWMFENQPDFVRELHRQKKLREHLDKKNQQALRFVGRHILAPGAGFNPRPAREREATAALSSD